MRHLHLSEVDERKVNIKKNCAISNDAGQTNVLNCGI